MLANKRNHPTPLQFKLKDEQLEQKISEYKELVDKEKIQRASWPSFCAFLGYTEQEVKQVMVRGDVDNSAYYGRSLMLKRMCTWIRGQLLSSKGWGGQSQSKAIFALKQDVGDGMQYTDKDNGPQGPQEIRVLFGGSDSRSSKAHK